MRRILWLVALIAMLAMPAGGRRADDGASIRSVIADQIAAFGRGDLDAAFAHASPGIQSKFGDAARFGQMVRSGYPMVWRPARVEMLGFEATARGPMQRVLFEDAAGALWEGDYFMEQSGGVWRIDGVQIRRLPGLGS